MRNLRCRMSPLRIVDEYDSMLRTKRIPIVKVEWQHHRAIKCTWELKAEMLLMIPSPLEIDEAQPG
ncbi:hypothetical protein EJ110_NYTH43556 [Nymphaea thermarum]|nr:hypothetical protein EJ110_NYTH43556 [Nymphaea thermarum]